MKLKKTLSAGFTLIELIVTVSIIMIITGGGIAAFVNFNDKQQVQSTVKDLQTMMRAAQIKARAGEGASECGTVGSFTNGKLYGYEVTYDALNNDIVMNRICVEGTTYVAVERSRQEVDSNVTLSVPDVTFLALKGGANTGAGSPDLTMTVSGVYTSYIYDFTVTPGGEITEGAFR